MKKRRGYTGQSLIETALVIPVVIFMITVFLDLGRAIYYYSALTNAVREGARYAIVQPDLDAATIQDIKDIVTHFSIALDPANLTIVVTPPAEDESDILIEASYAFKAVTPGLDRLLGEDDGITLNAESTMQLAPIAK